MIQLKIKYAFIFFVLAVFSSSVAAIPVQTDFQGLKLNANYEKAENKNKPFYLILHGTWSWNGSELSTAFQELLAEEDYGSLAITLSLNENNRTGPLDCKNVVKDLHQQAYAELHHWFQFLSNKGYKKIVLVAHSRGGAQAAEYVKDYPDDKISQLILIAPMTYDKDRVYKYYQKSYHQDLAKLVKKAAAFKDKKQLMKHTSVVYCKDATVTAESFLSYYGDGIERDTPTIIKQLKLPVRVYLGSEDSISNQFAKEIKTIKLHKNTVIKTIEGSDHFFRDLYLEDIVEDVLEHQP